VSIPNGWNITKNKNTTHPEIKDISSLSRKDSIYGNGFLSKSLIIGFVMNKLIMQIKKLAPEI